MLRGVSGVRRIIGDYQGPTKVGDDATAKIGNSEATITKGKWKEIQKLPKNEQKAELEKILSEKLPKKQMSLEDAEKAVKEQLGEAAATKNAAELSQLAEQHRAANTIPQTLEDVGISYRPASRFQ